MKILSLTAYVVRIPFRFSFKHALAERRRADSVLLRVGLDNGAAGWGEAVPRAYLTGESVDSVLADLREWAAAARALDLPDGVSPLSALFPLYETADAARKTAAYAALELAVLDAVGTASGRPAREMLGLPARAVKLTAPLGGGGVKSVRWLARVFKLLGFTDYKLKVGLRDNDAARLRAVREVIADRARFDLRIDANAAWDAALAGVRLREFAQFGVSSCEQPVARAEDFPEVAARAGCPLMADESLCTRADARRLLALGGGRAAGAAALWNLRLAKNGGFNGLFALRDLARDNGVAVHLGALVGETSLLTAAGRAAAGAAEFRHVEYGFPRILLRDDPFRGGAAGYFGTGEPASARPGWGVRLVPEALRRITVQTVEL